MARQKEWLIAPKTQICIKFTWGRSVSDSENVTGLKGAWKTKFEILEKAGADDGLDAYFKRKSKLRFREQFKISFNIWALVFGPFYYFYKKMCLKGAFLTGVVFSIDAVLVLIERISEINFPATTHAIPAAVLFYSMANYDYYRFCVKQERFWNGLPKIFSTKVGAIGFPCVAFSALMLVSVLSFGYDVPKCDASETVSLLTDILDIQESDQGGADHEGTSSYAFRDITTISTDDQTGFHTCGAHFYNTDAGGSNKDELFASYTVRITGDGTRFYINVFDIR
ncbi:DUF2628 domain-containing protein [Roseospira marina]|nr:DUF2628 domain-containing protein [Roseospira marina]MBB4315101.1 hypothetical protein [Roseospira marina]MBB5088129.1 hypothetical protein [Roseospira marina]